MWGRTDIFKSRQRVSRPHQIYCEHYQLSRSHGGQKCKNKLLDFRIRTGSQIGIRWPSGSRFVFGIRIRFYVKRSNILSSVAEPALIYRIQTKIFNIPTSLLEYLFFKQHLINVKTNEENILDGLVYRVKLSALY